MTRWKSFTIQLNRIRMCFWSGLLNSLFWSSAFQIISNNSSMSKEGVFFFSEIARKEHQRNFIIYHYTNTFLDILRSFQVGIIFFGTKPYLSTWFKSSQATQKHFFVNPNTKFTPLEKMVWFKIYIYLGGIFNSTVPRAW